MRERKGTSYRKAELLQKSLTANDTNLMKSTHKTFSH